MQSESVHEHFSSRWGFLLAAIGAAVGLGNIWKFPYMLGSNGGAAFVLVYLLAIVLIATPVMIGEMLLGRHGRMSAPNTLKKIATEVGASPNWKYLGWIGIVALFLVLSFFSVIGGWSIAYIFKTASGAFSGLTPAEVGGIFDAFLHQPMVLIGWHALFMAATIFIVSRGVKAGIEKAVTFMMPALFAMLVGLVIYGMFAGDFSQAVGYLFKPDFSKLTPEVTLSAFGQAFFSVNVGIGALLTYAAYLPEDVDLVKSSVIIAVGDTLVALLAGLMIFGPGLIFVTLSTAFGSMPGGTFIGTIFFVLVFLAALSSALSMLEVSICRLVEGKGRSRSKMAVALGSAIFLFGFLTVWSFNLLEDASARRCKTVGIHWTIQRHDPVRFDRFHHHQRIDAGRCDVICGIHRLVAVERHDHAGTGPAGRFPVPNLAFPHALCRTGRHTRDFCLEPDRVTLGGRNN
jgi:NSS family neurotransmitter:Na+ symporter